MNSQDWSGLPTEVVSRQVVIGDLNMHLLECLPLAEYPLSSSPISFPTSQKSRPPLVILLHGFPELAYSWRKIFVPLANAGYHVVAPDQRGFGLTVPISPSYDNNNTKRVTYNDDLRPYHILNIVADVVNLALALGYERVHAVVGHDYGSSVAAWAALIRPDMFERVVLMSTPFGGPPNPLEAEIVQKKEESKAYLIDACLRELSKPRKHYTVYFATAEANADIMNAPEGLKAFFRAYYHVKSADWEGNRSPLPGPLTKNWDHVNDLHQVPRTKSAQGVALAMEALPHYYIMPADTTMPEAVRPYHPGAEHKAACTWLTTEELQVYTDVYGKTGFQGGLNRYRVMTDETWNKEANVKAMGRKKMQVPVKYIAGAMDWGTWQLPGIVEAMRSESVVTGGIRDQDFVIVDGAGHWVQQEKPDQVVQALLIFFESGKATGE